MKYRWLSKASVLSFHFEQLKKYSGSDSIRDEGLLDSALSRPINHSLYGIPTIPELAAIYSHGIVTNHPFVDGNKRTGFIAGVTFLSLNGYRFTATNDQAIETVLNLASGRMSEMQIIEWFTKHSFKMPI